MRKPRYVWMLMALLLAAPPAAAQVFTPTFTSPRLVDDLGIYLSDGPGDLALEGIWRGREQQGHQHPHVPGLSHRLLLSWLSRAAHLPHQDVRSGPPQRGPAIKNRTRVGCARRASAGCSGAHLAGDGGAGFLLRHGGGSFRPPNPFRKDRV